MFDFSKFDRIKDRMTAFWNREKSDRCSFAFSVYEHGFRDIAGGYLYYDSELSDRVHRHRFDNMTFYGEALPCVFSYFGTAGIAEYAGCKATYTPETTWFEAFLDEPDASGIEFRRPDVFEKQRDALQRHVELAKNDYFVTVTDNCGIIDTLSQIRGSENLLMDMITDPDYISEAVSKLIGIYKKTQDGFFDTVRANNQGATHSWMHLWAPDKMAQLQCDFSVMISNQLYNEFVVPELSELTDYLSYSVYHLDGQEQIRHLDSLLSIPKLNAIQWTPVAGQPATSEFIPQFQKMQKAGKSLVLLPWKGEVKTILDNLSSRGLHLIISGIGSKEEAEEMMELINKHSVDRG